MTNNHCSFIDAEQGIENFAYWHRPENYTDKKSLCMHTHRDIEIYIPFSDNSEMNVENSRYILNAFDIGFMRPNERHGTNQSINLNYTPERVIIGISPSFFVKHNCEAYSYMFYNRPLGKANIIRRTDFESYGFLISDFIKRIEQYYSSSSLQNASAYVIIEFLHIANLAFKSAYPDICAIPALDNITKYIAEHISDQLSLDEIAKNCFISKAHMCRLFKKHISMSVNDYILIMRLEKAEQYIQNGLSLSAAAQKAGFKSYSGFYRTYKTIREGLPTEFKSKSKQEKPAD